MRFEGPVPTQNDVLVIVWALYLRECKRPVTTTQIMDEARARGFQGWHSAYQRRLHMLVDQRFLRIDDTVQPFGYVPIGGEDVD